MKLSPQWIRDFVDLSVDDRRLAEDLTNVGISVEGISGAGADTVFEMEIGTNRPDAMNHYGVAREAAAIYDRPLKAIDPTLPSAAKAASNSHAADAALKGRSSTPAATRTGADGSPFPITVEEPSLCPRFSARVIRGTHIKPSPGEDCAPAAVARSAADFECGRCHQLRPLGNGQAHARIRYGPA